MHSCLQKMKNKKCRLIKIDFPQLAHMIKAPVQKQRTGFTSFSTEMLDLRCRLGQKKKKINPGIFGCGPTH